MSIFEGNYNNNYTNENESKVSLLNWNCNIRYSILLSLYMMLTTMSIWVLNYYKITFICAMFISGPYKCGWTRITDVFQRNRFLVPLPDLKKKHFFSVGNHSRTVSQVLTYVVQTCKVQNFFPTTLYYANPTLQKSVVQFG